MLGNRGSRFDTGWLVTYFPFFFNLVEKNLLKVIIICFLSVAKMASLVYERENCIAEVTGSNAVEAFIFSGFFPIAYIGKFTAVTILHFDK